MGAVARGETAGRRAADADCPGCAGAGCDGAGCDGKAALAVVAPGGGEEAGLPEQEKVLQLAENAREDGLDQGVQGNGQPSATSPRGRLDAQASLRGEALQHTL